MKRKLLITLSLAALLLTACGRKNDSEAMTGAVPDSITQSETQGSVRLPVGEAQQSDAGAVELLSFECYEAFPQIPDFGSVNGYELYQSIPGENGATLYYYLSHYGDDDLKSEFWYCAERFSRAIQQQGFQSPTPDYGDTLIRFEQCGEYRVALYTVSRQDNEGVFSAKENLMLVVVKAAVPSQ